GPKRHQRFHVSTRISIAFRSASQLCAARRLDMQALPQYHPGIEVSKRKARFPVAATLALTDNEAGRSARSNE
ncbi:hypothetical protein ACFVY1_48395, partial [Streptomyces sp. NPDC058293]|uniref:hypothetical protein n=1 Tax=Streptomyces sp. NPDC058293 TaxID=3346429 RepID=UPI0036E4E6BA